MKIIQNLADPSRYSVKCPYAMTPTRVVVHNTANDAPAANEISYMIRNDNEVSFHYAVDDQEVVQGVPENRNTWNAGDGNGKGNREGIAVEICYSLSGGEKFTKAEQNAAEFIASILKRQENKVDPIRSKFGTIRREPVSLETKIGSVLAYARKKRRFSFRQLLERQSAKLEIVVTFLAVLELMKIGKIHLTQEETFGDMDIEALEPEGMEEEPDLAELSDFEE